MNNLLEIKNKVRIIWENVLDISDIDCDDNFFMLGGNSLNIIAVECEIIKEFQIELALEDIFKNLTINMLSKLIQDSLIESVIKIENIPKCAEREYYPLSWTQKEKFILEKLIDDNKAFNVTISFELNGKVNVNKLEQAFKVLIQRHESLRTIFKLENNIPIQIILEEVDFTLQYFNSDEKELKNLIKSFIKPFDISKEMLFRVALIKIENDKYVVLIDAHHIILDGYSINIMLSDLIKIYDGMELNHLKIQYKDYAVWQVENLVNTEKMSRISSFWKKQFEEKITLLNLPKDFQDIDNKKYLGDVYDVKLSYEINNKLKEYSKINNISIYNLLVTAYSILLSKYTGQTDILIGSIVLGRNYAYLNETIGDFTKTLPIRLKINEDSSIEEYIAYVQNLVLDVYDNQDYNFSDIYKEIQVADVMDIFGTLMNYHLESKEVRNLRFRDIEVKNINMNGEINDNRDIQLEIVDDENDCMVFLFQFNKLRFKRETIERMSNHFIRIINQIVSYKDLKLKNIKLLSTDEEKQLLVDFNDTEIKYDYRKTFVDLFEDQVKLTPNKIAVSCNNESITYKELNERANQLARILLNKGAGSNILIGIMVERSINMIIGVLSILKSGSAYVPFDVEYPEERIKVILEDSNINLIVTQKQFKKRFPLEDKMIYIEDEKIDREDKENLLKIVNSEDLAYVIYTSGTTGKPKGVMVNHMNLTNASLSWINCYKLKDFEVRLLQMASISFDVFVGDLARALINGGELVICPSNIKSNFYLLHSLISEKRISILESTPSLIIAFMDFIYDNKLEIPSLKILIMGSDMCSIKEYKRILSRFGSNIRILNSYGVTEATIDSSYYEENLEKVPNIQNTPIGKPMPNVRFYILDENRNLQPIGFLGELYIGGIGITSGYLNRKELTEEKFVEDIINKNCKMYKTGDLARWLEDGNVEFIGRIDNQVKIRGYRIELGEIENFLLEEAEIEKAVVAEKEDNAREKHLCAYIVSKETLDSESIKEKLRKKIPEYMIPQYIIQLEKFPITFNGKVDIKALPFEEVSKMKKKYIEPTNDLEKKLCYIMEEILKIEKVGINDDFFDLGGDSLKAILFITKVHKEFNVKISVIDLFENQCVENIAKNILKRDTNKYSSIDIVEEREYYPASSAQKRLYMLNQLDPKGTSYNIPIAIKIKGTLDIIKAQNTFYHLIDRHKILRTTFELKNNNIVQKINNKFDFLVEYDEVDKINFDFKNFQKQFIRPFDLEKGPLIRIKIIKICVDEFILQMDIHHIIADGQSIEILMDEFGKIYSGNELNKVQIQYKDYAVWQDKMNENGHFKEQEKYWMNMYKDSIPKLNMPLDYERAEIQSFEGDKISFELTEELIGKIKEICNETGTTVFMVLFASYATLLANYVSNEDIIIGVPILGRGHSDLEQIIGMFVNTLAIRIYPQGTKTFRQFLFEVKNVLLRSYENQDFELEKLIDVLKIERNINGNPLFDTIFNFRTNNISEILLENMPIEFLESNNKISKFDFYLNVFQDDKNINFEIEYCTKLFKRQTIERLSEYYVKVLSAISQNIDINLNEIELEDFKIEEFRLDDIEFNF